MRSLFRRVSSRLTIRQQLGLVVSLGILVLAAIAAIFIAGEAEERIENRLIRQGQHVAAALASTTTLSAELTSDPYGYVLPLLSLPSVAGIAIYNEEGELLFQRGVQVPAPQAVASSPPDSETYWYFYETIGQGQGSAGVAYDKAMLSEHSSGILQSNLMTALAAAGVMMILLLLVSGRIVRPLQTLSAAMGRARRGEYNVRTELTGSAELEAMGRAFNSMIYELDTRREQLLRSRDMALASARMKGSLPPP